jgi:hypothetical protein
VSNNEAHLPENRISAQLSHLDAQRFVGREDVLGAVQPALDGKIPTRVLLISGPGGIGKSALLREIGRRGQASGFTVHQVDGRLVGTSLPRLRSAFELATSDARPLVLVDSFEYIAALSAAFHVDLLPGLPAAAVVVIAGRRAFGPEWFRDGWDNLTYELPLRPLTDDEAHALLAQRGITGERAARVRTWARGLALALQIAAGSIVAVDDPLPRRALEATIVTRLVTDEAADVDPEVLSVAAIARSVDRRLLAAALPGRAARDGFAALRRLSITEPYGSRLTLHEMVRSALSNDLRDNHPTTHRRLVRAVADHLYSRVSSGDYDLLAELVSLIQDPIVRWGFSGGDGSTHRLGAPEPGDAAELRAALAAGGTAWWSGVERFFTEAPRYVTMARDLAGRLVGCSIVISSDNAPPWADEDPVLSVQLAHASGHAADGPAIIFRDAFDLTAGETGDPTSPVVALLNHPPHLRQELPYARTFYGLVPTANTTAHQLALSIGARRMPELDIRDGERELQTYLLDHGEHRLVGTVRSLVYAELGLPGPPPAAIPAPPELIDAAIRAALRSFHNPVQLAANPLARGTGVQERAKSVQTRLHALVAEVFGDTVTERLMQRLLRRGYLDPGGGHNIAMAEEHLSRTTYFRRLTEAVDRLGTAAREGATG